ncbi:hypothetical protein JCM14635_31360 [Megalodesulfovibrio paquesii]
MLCRAILAIVMVLAFASVALAKQVVIMNGTDFDIHSIMLSPSESNNWGEDLMGDDVLEPDEGVQITISGSANNWDLAAVDGDGTQVTFSNLDLRKVTTVTLHSDGSATLE